MKITLIVTGKTKAGWLKAGMDDYAGRLVHYVPFSVVSTPDLKNTRNMPDEVQKEKEGLSIIKMIPGGSKLILLDDKGKQYTSEGFAGFVNKQMIEGRDICMVVGGAYGFSHQLCQMADHKLSLSKMTFSHQMVRLIFLEQLYRAFTIIRGEPYHHA